MNKNFELRLIMLVVLGVAIMATNLPASTTAIQGTVRDARGRPLGGADIRIEARGGSIWNIMVKTDANGRYYYSGLPGGTYRVSLLVNAEVKASINNVVTGPGNPTELNFALIKFSESQLAHFDNGSRHMVWLPEETGTNLGGRWVDVANATGAAASDPVDRYGRAAVDRILQNGSVVGSNLPDKERYFDRGEGH